MKTSRYFLAIALFVSFARHSFAQAPISDLSVQRSVILGNGTTSGKTGTISPSQLTANTDNWAPTGFAYCFTIRVTTDASRNLTGIAGGVAGRTITLENVGSFPLVLKNDATSTAANRFKLSGDFTLGAGVGVLLKYDVTSSRWRILGSQGAGGGSGDVVGPGSSTDNAIARFDTTTGKLLQDSALLVGDTGIISFPDGIRQTFNPDGTNAGLNVGSQAGVPSSLSNGDIFYDSSANSLKARINGSTVALGAGSGDVVGPSSATDSRIAAFDGVTGKLLKDGGKTIAELMVGASSSTDNALVRFDSTTGKLVQDSNVTLADSGTALAFSGAAGLTAGGSNQDITLTPSGTGEVKITSSAGSTARLLEILGGSANYIQFNVGKDSTHYLTAEWDAIANNGNISTYGLSYPFRLRGNQVEIATRAADANSLVVDGSGNVRFNAYGAGTLTTDSSGNITATSDARLKDITRNFTRGLDAVLNLHPQVYRWKKETGLDSFHDYSGFIAQDVQAAIPEAVGRDVAGYLTLSDRPIMAAIVNAIKEQQQEIRILVGLSLFLLSVVIGLAVSVFKGRD